MSEYTTLEQAKLRLKQYHTEQVTDDDGVTSNVVVFDHDELNPLLEQLVTQATQNVKDARKYPSDYTDDMISEDIASYENVIVNLVVYDFSQTGESYMATYSENGISRSWVSREKLLANVTPIARIIT